MKIYQLIYTSVKHSLTDQTLGLINQPGYRVYSCSQGISKEDVNEVIRFCGYRLPKNLDVKYSEKPFDPTVPGKFPKIFRTLKTASGSYVAISVVYSGYDWEGEEGNFFAHAFIIEDADEGFTPEMFYGSGSFKEYLTPEESDTELVKYLPELTEPDFDGELYNKVDSFVSNHKIQMSAILEQVIPVLTGSEKTHICISAKSAEESAMYVLGLKRILPAGISSEYGIATNNVFLPSSGQNKIIINGTVTGKNNITEDDIQRRTNCVYIDVQRIETDGVKPMKLFEMSMSELHKSYEDFSIRSGKQLVLWLNSFERLTEEGVGTRLNDLYESVGERLFVERARSLYEKLNKAEMKQVRFEILEVMYEHRSLFPDIRDDLIKSFLLEGVQCICDGEQKNVENVFKDIDHATAVSIYANLDGVMSLVNSKTQKSQTLLLRIFSLMKNTAGIETWKEFFKDNKEYLSLFTTFCADVMISDTIPVTFTAPAIWTDSDTAEAIAYIDASTDDEEIHKACVKYILAHKNEAWTRYGIMIEKRKKSKEDSESDMMRIKKMLTEAGYVPYQRSSYKDLKFQVLNEMATNENPILLIRLLYAVYTWQGAADRVAESEKCAKEIFALIMELRETGLSLYRFVFPKLALEILDSPGYCHEIIINSQTMEPDFWNWFYVGFRKNAGNDLIRDNYERVLESSREEIEKMPVYKRIIKL